MQLNVVLEAQLTIRSTQGRMFYSKQAARFRTVQGACMHDTFDHSSLLQRINASSRTTAWYRETKPQADSTEALTSRESEWLTSS